MRPFYWVILIVAQIWLTCELTLGPVNPARAAYRREERAAALKAQDEDPSPATRAAVQEELHLAARHVAYERRIQAGGLLVSFLAVDAFFVYARKYLKREPRATGAPNQKKKRGWVGVAFSLLPVALTTLVALALTGCDSGWSGVHKEAGPVPLSSPDKPIARLVDKRTTFEVGEETRLYWDEGSGPILYRDRLKPLLESIPKELSERLHSQRDVPAKLYAPFTDTGTTYEYLYDAWEVVVSLNPDVLVLSVYERPVGPHNRLPPAWDWMTVEEARRKYIDRRVEIHDGGGWGVLLCAGTLVPWSKEMHVFSTDPKVRSGRLTFENNRAEVLLPDGKLVLVRQDDDVEVTRVAEVK